MRPCAFKASTATPVTCSSRNASAGPSPFHQPRLACPKHFRCVQTVEGGQPYAVGDMNDRSGLQRAAHSLFAPLDFQGAP